MRLQWASLAAAGTLCLTVACGPSQPEAAPAPARDHAALTAEHTVDNTNASAACTQFWQGAWTGNGADVAGTPLKPEHLDLNTIVHHHMVDEGTGTESNCDYLSTTSGTPPATITVETVTCPSGDGYTVTYAGSAPPNNEVSRYCTGSGAKRTCNFRQRIIDFYETNGIALWVDALGGSDSTCRTELAKLLPSNYNSKPSSLTNSLYFDGDTDGYPSSMCCVYYGTRGTTIAAYDGPILYANGQTAVIGQFTARPYRLFPVTDVTKLTSRTGYDCDDRKADINVGISETLLTHVNDGVDQNCDGKDACLQDDDDDNYPQSPAVVTTPSGMSDPYNPTLGNCLALTRLAPNDPNDALGTVHPPDCNDNDYTVHPNPARSASGALGNNAAVEVAGNTIDEDCDGTIRCALDADGDGYGSNNPSQTKTVALPGVCGQIGSGTSANATDCDDANSQIHPGATDLVGDGLDQDCDYTDRCYPDDDADGWGDPSATPVIPTRPSGTPPTTLVTCDSTSVGWRFSSVADDCDDSDPAVHKNSSFDGTYRLDPGDRVTDIAGDTIDQDCDGRLTCFVDLDGDGFGVNGTTKLILASGANTCANQDLTVGVAKYGGDCNDTVANDGANMHPNSIGGVNVAGTVRNGPVVYGTAVEVPGDNLDQDCDNKDLCFADKDNDNYGVDASITANVTPSAAASVLGWNADGSLKVPYCRDTANASENSLDCNDQAANGSAMHPNTNRAVPGYPSALVNDTAGDNIDQDCDGRDICFEDSDNDNYGTPTASSVSGPTAPTGPDGVFTDNYCGAQGSVAANAGDCDDADPAINPGADEIPGDDLDQNCDGGDACFIDRDGDHYGGTNSVGISQYVDFTGPINPPANWVLDGTVYPNDRCDTKPGYSKVAGDCNDTQGDPTSSSVHPNTHPDATYRTSVAVEIVGDQIDQDCDSADSCYADADGDNWGVTATVTAADMPLPANPAYPGVFTLAGHIINGVPIAANSPLLFDCVAVPAAARFPGDCNDTAFPVDFLGHGPGWAFHPNTSASGITPGNAAGYTPSVELVADDVDHDCDGRDLCYADADNDNYGVPVATSPAVVPSGLTDTIGALSPDFCERADNAAGNAEDCNDVATPVDGSGHGPGYVIHPNTYTGSYYVASVEIVGDDKDQDCDLADTCYVDADDDNYGVTVNANGTTAVPYSLASQFGLADKLHCVGAPFAAKFATGDDVDCDDRNPKAHPNTLSGPGYTPSVEVVADNVDQNCDYNDDCYDDVDNDGFGTTKQITLTEGTRVNPMPFSCTEERYASATNDDCDDANPYIYPGAPETVGDVIDEDCNLKLDCYFDGDDDGYGDPNHAVIPDAIATLAPDGTTHLTCDDPSVANISANKGDCDDTDPLRNPGKDTPDLPGDAIDQNCDGYLDCFVDADNDGHGDDNHGHPDGANIVVKAVVATPAASCSQSATDHFATAPDDCFDDDAKRFPFSGLTCGSSTTPCEVCEQSGPQLDDDCDGSVNTATIPATPYVGEHTVPVTTTSGGWIAAYLDADGDGFGSNDARLYTPACEITPGTSSNNLDCDDEGAPVDADGHGAGWYIHPGVFEKCDGIDQNCNGVADEAEAIDPDPANQSNAGCLVMYRDRDRDGTGDPTVAHCVCPDPRQPAEPYVAVSDTDVNDTDWFDQSVEVSPLHGTYAGEDYVAPSTDCDDAHADVRPDECHDGLDNDGDGWVDAADDGCKVGMGTDGHGFGVRSASETNRSSTFRHDPSAVRAVVERIDGHDNDCNGEIPAIELDCDDDSSFPLLPVNPPPETFLHAADLGLTSCTDDGSAPALRCWDQQLELSCDGFTGLWVTRYGASPDGFGGRYNGGYRVVTGTSDCSAVGDCDDHCANRCPDHAETCDGVDNNCSLVADMSVPTAQSLPQALSGEPIPGTVVAAELDFDADGHASCTDDFLNGDAEIHQAPLTCSAFTEETKLSDCDDLCFYENADAVEVCDGFVNVCGASPSAREGADRDEDDHVTCGAYGPADTIVDEDVFVPVWVDCNRASVTGTALAAACPSPAPAPAVTPTTPGPSLVPLISPRARAAVCDAPLSSALAGVAERAGIADPQAWVEGKDSTALVRALCAPSAKTGGLCSVVKVSLLRDEDLLGDGTGGALEPDCAEVPEQASVRTVWPTGRIVEAREGVVEEECLRLFGTTCDKVQANTPRVSLGVPPVVDAQLGEQLTDDTDTDKTTSPWWLEFGRFAPRSAAGAVMTCWGDPRTEAIGTQTGGDCDDATNDASRDLAEGPNDLVLAYNGLNGDCSRCVDGIDNNCDGLTDCADPTCSVCFVGQGQGCAGSRDACGNAADTGGGCTTGADGRNLAVLGMLPLLGLVARRRARRTPDGRGV